MEIIVKTNTACVANSNIVVSGTISNGTSTSTSANINTWSTPELLETRECQESIEMVYKQTSNISYGIHSFMNSHDTERIYKIVYSCVEGKWHKSEPIFGKIVPAQDAYYDFE